MSQTNKPASGYCLKQQQCTRTIPTDQVNATNQGLALPVLLAILHPGSKIFLFYESSVFLPPPVSNILRIFYRLLGSVSTLV